MEKRGKPTSYITGEEREIRPGAQFVSSTIEMLDLDRPIDRVVIDEVQLLADERRGWAWLAAFVGAPASRVIMTGSPDCVAMVRWLASYLGEDLEIVDCQRYNELKVADVPSQLHNLPTATAVVCFSRRDVLTIKAQIEETSKHRVAVVYGNLSPQVRREEARRFRSGEADILVATDAIAMGLNLPIHQVVFFKTEKYDGETTRPLEYSEIRQIAGRAGRYGFAQFGVASALTPQALNLVRMAIRSPQKPLEPTFYVAPGPNHVRIIGKVLGTDSLERILTFFEKAMDFSNPSFARANIDELSFLSSYIDEALPHMTPVERLGIACAPVDLKSDTVLGWFLERMVPAFGAALDTAEPEENPDFLDDLFEDADRFSVGSAPGSMELRRAEDYLKSLTVYAWLAYRYSHVFPRIDDCQKSREIVNAYIERSLRSGVVRRCTGCKKQLPAIHPYRQCEECFQKTKKTRFQYSGNDRRRRS
jgi:ATP-dependent RNA helicase SUPV3L1/SUV3